MIDDLLSTRCRFTPSLDVSGCPRPECRHMGETGWQTTSEREKGQIHLHPQEYVELTFEVNSKVTLTSTDSDWWNRMLWLWHPHRRRCWSQVFPFYSRHMRLLKPGVISGFPISQKQQKKIIKEIICGDVATKPDIDHFRFAGLWQWLCLGLLWWILECPNSSDAARLCCQTRVVTLRWARSW